MRTTDDCENDTDVARMPLPRSLCSRDAASAADHCWRSVHGEAACSPCAGRSRRSTPWLKRRARQRRSPSEDAFHAACAMGRPSECMRLLHASGADLDVNWRHKDGSTPLLAATWGRHLEVVKALVVADSVDLECQWVGRGGDTPLMVAAEFGEETLVEVLLLARASAEAQNPLGGTALHRASQSGNDYIVEVLLNGRACVNARSSKGGTPILVGAENGHAEVVRCLYAADALLDSSVDGCSPLVASAMHGSVDVIQLLLSWGHAVDEHDGCSVSPLVVAAANQNRQVTMLLARARADPLRVCPVYGMSALEACLTNKNMSLLRALANVADNPQRNAIVHDKFTKSALRHSNQSLPSGSEFKGDLGAEATAGEFLARGRFSAALLALEGSLSTRSALAIQVSACCALSKSAQAVQAARAALALTDVGDLESQEDSMRRLVEAYLSARKVSAAHVCVAEWSSECPSRADAGWRLQQFCFSRSPFVWSHHRGLEVMKSGPSTYGMRTRLPISAHERVICECAAADWSSEEVRDMWRQVDNQDPAHYADMLEGLFPRTLDEVQAAWHCVPASSRAGACGAAVAQLPHDQATSAQFLVRVHVNGHDDGVHLSEAFVNHSCRPNCELRGANHAQLFATHDIEAGEELCISYLQFADLFQPQLSRSCIFADSFGGACECERCAEEAGESSDEAFQVELARLEQRLITVATAVFPEEIRYLCSGELLEFSAQWKRHMVDLVIEHGVLCRLEQLGADLPIGDLQLLAEALLAAHARRAAICGESVSDAPLREAILELEDCLRRAPASFSSPSSSSSSPDLEDDAHRRPTEEALAMAFREVRRAHRACSGK